MTSKRLLLPISAKQPAQIGDLLVPTNHEMAHHLAIGSVLGDGGIHKKDYYIGIEQKSPTYALWKQKLFTECGIYFNRPHPNKKTPFIFKVWGYSFSVPLSVKVRTLKTRKRKAYLFSFNSRSMFHEKWRSLFYKENPKLSPDEKETFRKALPPDLKDYFWGNLALAIFYMDDGWIVIRKSGQICVALSTGEWTYDECDIMIDCLKQNFNLDAVVYPKADSSKPNRTPHHFYIQSSSYPQFKKLVQPEIDKFKLLYPNYAASSAMKNRILP